MREIKEKGEERGIGLSNGRGRGGEEREGKRETGRKWENVEDRMGCRREMAREEEK